ncbi:UDP-N-acetylmuramate dehydrogenase [Desulfomicrobium norvegicum]|uniref:UDP-N-acetylenolpyruvoylglucosamine reductase n=1 Tax=Desulfomicrobium norvegicum (strain DSM 1741 / NCIMB 8310) TaxID=52561 RepID=A0A8G2C149_DESNO|nr:UDP-N-acetylmuramate dehydrogenase [Desulfomicrobium norvegicum]SFL45203.1 UDP-N-acetylmuramate dehydrogenase [Desulfomicrobium norvegicum]
MKHLQNVPLKNYCTFRIGGVAKDIFFPENAQELAEIVLRHRSENTAFWIHGGGANTLFPDDEILLPVISTSEMTACVRDGGTVRAEAGKTMDAWVLECLREGLGGIECLSGIPGTLGGALYMNAGAYGHEISDHLVCVTILTKGGRVIDIPKEECGFGYRQALALREAVVLAGTWNLPQSDPSPLLIKRKEILARRKEKQPLEFPSAGSVFKRPTGAYASQLIDQAGLKGLRVGGAQVSEKHAGFIVNVDNATCRDVLDLVEICRKTVRERFGYELELEQCLCPFCPDHK